MCGAAVVLQALQIEDLERLASLPLAEAKYQKLTNVTLLEMLNEIFTYGATQVGKLLVSDALLYIVFISHLLTKKPFRCRIRAESVPSEWRKALLHTAAAGHLSRTG
jgi:hypothetical protein